MPTGMRRSGLSPATIAKAKGLTIVFEAGGRIANVKGRPYKLILLDDAENAWECTCPAGQHGGDCCHAWKTREEFAKLRGGLRQQHVPSGGQSGEPRQYPPMSSACDADLPLADDEIPF